MPGYCYSGVPQHLEDAAQEASLTGSAPGDGSTESNPGVEEVNVQLYPLTFLQNCEPVIFASEAHAPLTIPLLHLWSLSPSFMKLANFP